MMRTRLVIFSALVLLAACGGSSSKADAGDTQDSGVVDAGADCVSNPSTHLELINACTSAVAIVRHPVLPLLLADGGVPPLP